MSKLLACLLVLGCLIGCRQDEIRKAATETSARQEQRLLVRQLKDAVELGRLKQDDLRGRYDEISQKKSRYFQDMEQLGLDGIEQIGQTSDGRRIGRLLTATLVLGEQLGDRIKEIQASIVDAEEWLATIELNEIAGTDLLLNETATIDLLTLQATLAKMSSDDIPLPTIEFNADIIADELRKIKTRLRQQQMIAGEKKKLELNEAARLKRWVSELQEKLDLLTNQERQVRQKWSSQTRQVAALRDQILKKDGEIATKETAISRLERDVVKLSSELRQLKQRLAPVNQTVASRQEIERSPVRRTPLPFYPQWRTFK